MVSAAFLELLEQYGYKAGSKDEATHYSTMYGSDWLICFKDDKAYYWDELSKSWHTCSLDLQYITLLGQQEAKRSRLPRPQAQKKVVVQKPHQPTDIYYPNRARGSHRAGD